MRLGPPGGAGEFVTNPRTGLVMYLSHSQSSASSRHPDLYLEQGDGAVGGTQTALELLLKLRQLSRGIAAAVPFGRFLCLKTECAWAEVGIRPRACGRAWLRQ